MQARPTSGVIEAGGPRAVGPKLKCPEAGASLGGEALGARRRVEQVSLCRANFAQAGLAVLTAGGSWLSVGGWAVDRLLLLTAKPAAAKPLARWAPLLYQHTHELFWRLRWRSSALRS